MSDDLAHVKPGDKFRISARTHNAWCDAARQVLGEQHNISSSFSSASSSSGIVLVRNDSGSAMSRYQAVGIDALAISPADNPNAMVLAVATLDYELHEGHWCVLQEPLASGAIGKAVVSGVTYCQVTAQLPEQRYVEVSQYGGLYTAYEGTAQLLWHQKDGEYPASGWALIRLGLPAGQPPADTTGAAQHMVHQLRDYGGVLVPVWDFMSVHP